MSKLGEAVDDLANFPRSSRDFKRTLVIFTESPAERPTQFFFVPGAHPEYDKVSINSSATDPEVEESISSFLFNENGEIQVPMLYDFPLEEVLKGDVMVVQVHFLL